MPARGEALLPNHLALAQVHATLALVEQQRIANLIELAKGAAGSDARQAAYDALLGESGEGFDFKTFVRPDIARALDLEVSDD